MRFKLIFLIILHIQINVCVTLQFIVHPDRDLSMAEIFAKYGYSLESHELVTDDGYILTMHRIPRGRNSTSAEPNNKHPVLLVHGTCGCADNFIIPGPGKAIVYYLADRGFDVWMVNTRGSRHSRKHKTLNPDTDKDFWNFGWHEVGTSDIPASIDYILEETNNTKLFYVGHSQGATAYFAFASERPEYNSKIIVSVNMAPSCFLGDTRNTVKIMGKQSSLIQMVTNFLNVYELFPGRLTELINLVSKTLCSETSFFLDFCYAALYFGEVYGDMPQWTPQLLFSRSPAHCSIKQLIHYFQIVHSGIFRKYDYGIKENLKIYGTKTPPLYSFSNMTAPIALFYAPQDNICPEKGVKKLAKVLPNLAKLYKVPSDKFGHIDFILGKRVKKLVNEHVYQLFKTYL